MTLYKDIDVRTLLRKGGEPFRIIMNALEALAPGEGLRLLATFEPQPLYRVMAERGFDHVAHQQGDGDWEVLFTPVVTPPPVSVSRGGEGASDWGEPVFHLDLADLEPPEPMVRILRQIELMEPGEVLFALLGREPVFLLPELERRGHRWVCAADETGVAWRLLVQVGEETAS
jgi:uncharacterized protein (DUF2249 family)